MRFKASELKPILFLLMLVVSGVFPFLIFQFPTTAHEFGEAFGFMGALFGGLALFYLAASVTKQLEANEASAQAIRASTKLAAMTALSDHLRSVIEQYRTWENSAKTDEKKILWQSKRLEAQASLKKLVKEMWSFAGLPVDLSYEEAES